MQNFYGRLSRLCRKQSAAASGRIHWTHDPGVLWRDLTNCEYVRSLLVTPRNILSTGGHRNAAVIRLLAAQSWLKTRFTYCSLRGFSCAGWRYQELWFVHSWSNLVIPGPGSIYKMSFIIWEYVTPAPKGFSLLIHECLEMCAKLLSRTKMILVLVLEAAPEAQHVRGSMGGSQSSAEGGEGRGSGRPQGLTFPGSCVTFRPKLKENYHKKGSI